MRAWLASPVAASLMILLVISIFYHARLGVQVVIEDYVHHEGAKLAALAALTLVAIAARGRLHRRGAQGLNRKLTLMAKAYPIINHQYDCRRRRRRRRRACARRWAPRRLKG